MRRTGRTESLLAAVAAKLCDGAWQIIKREAV
jgi:hypothetical protein